MRRPAAIFCLALTAVWLWPEIGPTDMNRVSASDHPVDMFPVGEDPEVFTVLADGSLLHLDAEEPAAPIGGASLLEATMWLTGQPAKKKRVRGN